MLQHFIHMAGTAYSLVPADGLNNFWSTVRDNWIKPVFLAAIAVFAIMFLKNRSWTQLIGFIGIAAIVGVLIFAGGDLFGSANKGLTGVANEQANKVGNVIDITKAVKAPAQFDITKVVPIHTAGQFDVI